MKRRVLLLVLLLNAVAGCVNYGTPGGSINPETGGQVNTWHDDDRHVTCWILSGYRGISCLPDR